MSEKAKKVGVSQGSNAQEFWSEGALIKMTVEKAIYGGKMMGSAHDGRVVWLQSSEPLAIGDLISGQVMKVAKRSYEVSVIEVLQKSTERVEPFCPHIARCGGCPWQAIPLEHQVMSLERDIGRMLSRAHGSDLSLAPTYVSHQSDPQESQALWQREWRHTARLHIDGQTHPLEPTLGFYGPNGLFDLDHCPVFSSTLNEILVDARSRLLPVLGGGNSELRISAAQEAHSGTVALSLIGVWPEEKLSCISATLEDLVSSSGRVHGASFEAHTAHLLQRDEPFDRSRKQGHKTRADEKRRQRRGGRKADRRSNDRAQHAQRSLHVEPVRQSWGAPYNRHHGVDHPASAFMQAHQEGNRILIDEVVEGARDAKSIIELYAGSGNFTLALARADKDRTILALEYDERAVSSLQTIADNEGLKIEARSQLINTLPQVNADHIILDPPRSGASSIIDELSRSRAQKLTYISCHPAALARDLAQLVERGWRAERTRIFHLFPHSGHAEVYCRLSRIADPSVD